MTILNRPSDGTVSTLVTLWRTLRTFGEMSREQLLALCAPRVEPEHSKIPITVSTWTALGLLTCDHDICKLTSPFDQLPIDNIEGLRTEILNLLLKTSNAPHVVNGVNLASDFVRVSCWALAQDPYELASSKTQRQIQTKAADQNIILFEGDGRWNGFLEWAHFTGIGMPTRHGFVVCPTRAIRARLDHYLELDHEVEISHLLTQLAEDLPVIDGGHYRTQIESRLPEQYQTAIPKISPSLSLTFLQLVHEGELVLYDRPGDVAQSFTLLGYQRQPIGRVSHVKRQTARFASIQEIN